ncbi:unnamed protein product [Musa acuminata subsp. burmannicoides]
MGNLNTNLVLMLALLLSPLPLKGASDTEKKSDAEYVPVTPVKYRPVADVPGGVRAAYKQCSDCRCCSATDQSKCETTKCCYELICNDAVNPAANCSFKPTACNCNNCN